MIHIDNKLFPVWKPTNIRSNLIVEKIRSLYNVKVGHAGTLDPFAEGILLICTGNKTKDISKAQSLTKVYHAKILLGSETNTLDKDGFILKTKCVRNFSKNELNEVLSEFVGDILQRPPAFSALKKNSVRLYKLARKGIYINLLPRKIKINSLNLISQHHKSLTVEVSCEKGTYIRCLARDIALRLGTYGHLETLKRVSIGHYKKDSCLDLNLGTLM